MPQANIHTVRLTAAADTTLPRTGLWLAQVRVFTSTTPGSFQYRYNGSALATFLAPSNGTRGRRTWRMRQQIVGNFLPSGGMVFTGGVSAVELDFTDVAPGQGKAWDDLRGEIIRRVDAGATTAAVAVNFAVAPAAPKYVEVFQSASAGRVTFPSIDQLTFQAEAIVGERGSDEDTIPAPPFSPSNSLSPTVITDGAATIHGAIYY